MAQVTSEGPWRGAPQRGPCVPAGGRGRGRGCGDVGSVGVLLSGRREQFEQRPDRQTGFPLALCVLRLSCTPVNPVGPRP